MISQNWVFVILYRPELGDYEKTLNRIDLYENYFLTASQNFIFINLTMLDLIKERDLEEIREAARQHLASSETL